MSLKNNHRENSYISTYIPDFEKNLKFCYENLVSFFDKLYILLKLLSDENPEMSEEEKQTKINEYFFSEFNVNNTIEIYNKLFYLIDNATIPYLDLYAITRIFKQPEGGKRSLLSICYFGNFHIRNIVYLLGQTGLYETSIDLGRKKDDDDDDNRCIDLDNVQLNLNDELYDKILMSPQE